MITKTFEIRDKATFIPVLAIQLISFENEQDRYLLSRAGYGRTPGVQFEYVLLAQIAGGGGRIQCDYYDWGGYSRTYQIAHKYIQENFNELTSGEVIDVEFILGETDKPKVSEAMEK